MKNSKNLTNTQVVLAYLVHIVGSKAQIEKESKNGTTQTLQNICEKFVNYNCDSLDNVGNIYTDSELVFMRKALSGVKFGNYTNGKIAGIFGYSANI